MTLKVRKYNEYQPSNAGGTHSPPATPHPLEQRTQHCQLNPKWPQGAPKYPMGSGKGLLLGFWVLQSTFTKLVL